MIGQSVQVGEKTFANFRVETRNPGGHSSTPVRDNAIYQLSRALLKIDGHEFPLEMTDTTRRYFKRSAGAARTDDIGRAMVALAANPRDQKAEAIVNKDRFLHSNLRTTCVATLLDAGHAANALPQRAGANVNCRIFPGHSIEEIRRELAAVIEDPGVTVTALPPVRPSPPAPPLDSTHRRSDADAGREVLARRPGRFPRWPTAIPTRRSWARPASRPMAFPDVGRSRRQRRPRPQRADRGAVGVCRTRLHVRLDQSLCGLRQKPIVDVS